MKDLAAANYVFGLIMAGLGFSAGEQFENESSRSVSAAWRRRRLAPQVAVLLAWRNTFLKQRGRGTIYLTGGMFESDY